jgi:gluconate 2-dehydrogenase subunit 3-like protein
VTGQLTRRQVLRWGVAGGTLLLLPAGGLLGCGEGDEFGLAVTPTPTPVPSFLSPDEQNVLAAVTARIVPTDDSGPGAVETGAPRYINLLLSILPDEHSPGMVFAGGPFSNRNQFPDPATGTPSTRFPPNDFTHFISLTRLQLMSWRVQLLGSAAVPGADFNDAVLGPKTGIRERYRTGLSEVQTKSMQLFGSDFVALSSDQQDTVLGAVDASFVDLVTGHTLEGMFCAPEYGGNTNLSGWTLIKYDGDSQPLGYAIFDESTMEYKERPGKPTTTADMDDDMSGVDADTERFLKVLVKIAARQGGNTPFFTP